MTAPVICFEKEIEVFSLNEWKCNNFKFKTAAKQLKDTCNFCQFPNRFSLFANILSNEKHGPWYFLYLHHLLQTWIELRDAGSKNLLWLHLISSGDQQFKTLKRGVGISVSLICAFFVSFSTITAPCHTFELGVEGNEINIYENGTKYVPKKTKYSSNRTTKTN